MAVLTQVTLRRRIAGFMIFLSVIYLVLVGRLGYIQFFQGDELQDKALDQWTRDIRVEPKRGIIYDRNGRELAVSVSVPTLVAIPAEIRDPQGTAEKLAAILGMGKQQIVDLITARRAQVYVKRKIEAEQANAIRELDLDGLYFTEESRRYYPKQNLASQLLGFSGIDSQGLEGLELYYDELLRGKPGRIVTEKDAGGRELPQGSETYLPPENGYNLYLTIDEVIQRIVERELETALVENNAKSASAIVVDPNTGEVLAMATKPDYDPNHYADYHRDLWRNKVITDAFEPGSTFKIVTSSAAIEEGKVTESSPFFDPGFVKVATATIHCWKHGGHGSETFLQAVKASCNPVFVALGQRLGRDTLFSYLKTFGFGQKSGIDIAGDATGILFPLEKVGPVELATTAFGQGPAVTPIQQIMAVSVVANGGELMRPFLAKEFRDEQGNLVQSNEPEVKRRVISEETAKRMRDILAYVINAEPPSKAASSEYVIAAKTGTAQKIRKGGAGYDEGRYVASTIGFAPAADPQIALYVYVDEPNGPNGYYGGQVAAPVFGRIAESVLRYLEVPSSTSAAQPKMVELPELRGLTVGEAQQRLVAEHLSWSTNGQGERVIEQFPLARAQVPEGQVVQIRLGSDQPQTTLIAVPELIGKSVQEAQEILHKLGLNASLSGTGLVYDQNPRPGTQVESGKTVAIKCKPPTP
ncbi:MAG: stage V sporulation protein D [Bacillota bacterium]